MLRTALEAGVVPESVFLGAEAVDRGAAATAARLAGERGARVFLLGRGVLERVADTVTPQPVLAVVPMASDGLAALAGGRLVVVMLGTRDPGNAGTVVRSADAAGADAVVSTGTSVDPYNPKAVRASAGSLFHLPVVVEPEPAEVLRALAEYGYRRLGTTVQSATSYTDVDWTVPTAIVLGNETAGLNRQFAGSLDAMVRIPMPGKAESLNVGVACAVLCFESLRQRQEKGEAGRGDVTPRDQFPSGRSPTGRSLTGRTA